MAIPAQEVVESVVKDESTSDAVKNVDFHWFVIIHVNFPAEKRANRALVSVLSDANTLLAVRDAVMYAPRVRKNVQENVIIKHVPTTVGTSVAYHRAKKIVKRH